MNNASFVLHFSEPRCREVKLSGGKGRNMAIMVQEGLPVPPGFVITSAAFLAAVERRMAHYITNTTVQDAAPTGQRGFHIRH